MIISFGVWFPWNAPQISSGNWHRYSPWTHMIDGAGLVDIFPHLLIMLAMSIVFMAIGARSFRWE
ncbi:hypothetical protein [Sedimenticola selenatireducens]|uniref:hypothetical protein n=1 Tax=Sedimenticola selenatireducens TaxID=191960 RepID=UPI003F4A8639